MDLDIAEEEIGSDHSEIVGGSSTDITAVPWQVSLQTANGSHFCGGSILAERWIATAAHCLGGGTPARIVAGSTLLSDPNAGQIVPVLRAIPFPGYTDATNGKDFALLELSGSLTLGSPTVQAIRPAIASDVQAGLENPGVTALVSGWGALSAGSQSLPDNLQSVEVPIISLTEASADYGRSLSSDQIAAGLRGVGGKDSCQGDSGGPLIVRHPTTSEPRLIGVVSWGNGCADPNFPGMYARTSSFFTFIDDHLGGMPSANAGQDQVVALGAAVTLDASASSDVGVGSIVSYSWTQTLGTPVAVGDSGATTQFTAPMSEDDLEFEVTVTDDRGNVSTDRVTVQAQANAPDPDGPGGDSDGDGTPDDFGSADVIGGCSAGGASSAPLLALLLLGALVARRKRQK